MHHQPEAFLGALAADAVAMPSHLYYDRAALARDYGTISGYAAPRNPHPDSILYRSSYTPPNAKGEILHDQAVYWGQRGIHYHQFLRPGENTLNFQLARLLYKQITPTGRYDSAKWLRTYTEFMLTPQRHADTYVEECHRGFFTNYANDKKPRECATKTPHIGGLASVPALFDGLKLPVPAMREAVQEHVSLTHRDPDVLRAADDFLRVLNLIRAGKPPRTAILAGAPQWISSTSIDRWLKEPDDIVIGERLSPTCNITDAFPASLYLAWKYADNFAAGICVNAQVGGDSCHRGAVVGAILGAAHGVPLRWSRGLRDSPIGTTPKLANVAATRLLMSHPLVGE